MSNERAIPAGYMTVGALAKRMGTTVRTLQYYDREGLLSPSAESEGGRRLYTDRDVVKLHQIMSLKYLGFSLDDIKNMLISPDTPQEMAVALTAQAEAMRTQIAMLSESLKATEALREEVLCMQRVDFEKCADIVVNLRMKNDYYWMIKHLDERSLAQIRQLFDEQSAVAMVQTCNRLFQEAAQLSREGVAPESAQAQAFAESFWKMVMEFTGGDMGMLAMLRQTAGGLEKQEEEALAIKFVEAALSAYFDAIGYDPFEEGQR